MATIKNAAELKNSAKETRATIGAKNTAEKLKQVAGKGSINLKPELTRPAKEPVVDFINSVSFNNKQLLNCTANVDYVKWEFVGELKGSNLDDVKAWLADNSERIRGVEIKDRVKAERVINGFKSFSRGFKSCKGGLSLEILPTGGVRITCLGENHIANTNITPKVTDFKLSFFSYDLQRKAKNQDQWLELGNGSTCCMLSFDDYNSLKEGTQYTYMMTVTNLETNNRVIYRADILFEALNVEIVKFEVYPDKVRKRVHLDCVVKNAIESQIRITRDGLDTPLYYNQADVKVDPGYKYKYVLHASNHWNEDVQETAIADCTNIAPPSKGKVSYKLERYERGAAFSWTSVSDGNTTALERNVPGTDVWKVIFTQMERKGYTDIDKELELYKTYNYRVKYENDWGKVSYSDPVAVEMVNDVFAPDVPRILPPGECTLKWIVAKDVKEYYVRRNDKTDKEKIEFSSKQSSVSYTDTSAVPGKLYTYEIIACGAWGESISYQNVKPCESLIGVNNDDCYLYKEQNKNQGYDVATDRDYVINFQGIATDGKWWYLTNGEDGYWSLHNPPSLRRAGVDNSLNRDIDCEYNCPDRKNVHIGDLECYGNYLFVAVYKTNKSEKDEGQIWIFDKNSLERLTTVKLFRRDGSTHLYKTAWCAVNPLDGRLYTSNSYVGKKYNNPICSYQINYDAIGKPNGDIFPSKSCREIYLIDENGDDLVKESMQGGCFDYYNNLYLNSGLDGSKANEGIQVFRLLRDEKEEYKDVMNKAKNDVERSKLYEAYKSGDLNLPVFSDKAVLFARSNKESGFRYQFDATEKEEPEGLVYYDFNYAEEEPDQDAIKKGSFHATLLRNSDNSCREWMWFKHYQHMYRETETKRISYNPDGLKILIEYEMNTVFYKIVNQGILIKKFTTESAAIKALNVLKNFRKEHCRYYVIDVVGWLKTSSPNHNYEFSALEWNGSSLLQKEGLTTEGNGADCHVIEFDANSIQCRYENERYLVYFSGYDKKKKEKNTYHFCAHNEADKQKIYDTIKNFKKICIIGVGPDTKPQKYFNEEKIDYGYRIRSENNLIWLEN